MNDNTIFPLDYWSEEDQLRRKYVNDIIGWLYTKLPAKFAEIYVCIDRFNETSYNLGIYSDDRYGQCPDNRIIIINMRSFDFLPIPVMPEPEEQLPDYDTRSSTKIGISKDHPTLGYLVDPETNKFRKDVVDTSILHTVVHEWIHPLVFTDFEYSADDYYNHNAYLFQIEYLVDLKTYWFIINNMHEIRQVLGVNVDAVYLTEMLNCKKARYFNNGIFPLK